MKIVLATRNRDKVNEIRDLLIDLEVQILTLNDFPEVPEIIEDRETLEQNAYKKAKTVFDATGILSVADDTGLEVDALNGQPGVYSSRFAGEQATYDDNVNKLLQEMENVPDDQRSAIFRTVISIVGENINELVEGRCKGIIVRHKKGNGGFGYDPVFYVPEYRRTFAEMPLSLKNQISHRGQALQKAIKILKQIITHSE